MFNIEYEIGLNDAGRPCIELPEDYEHRPEDRFFVLEVASYMLQDLLKRRTIDLDSQTINAIDEAERLLGQIGDDIAEILYGSMKAQAELDFILDKQYHIRVNSIEERDELPEKNILFNDKIFDRTEGLIILIDTPKLVETRYKLVDGISNENWVKL